MEPELAPPCAPPATSWQHCLPLYLLAKDSLALGTACPSTLPPSCWTSCKETGRPFSELHLEREGELREPLVWYDWLLCTLGLAELWESGQHHLQIAYPSSQGPQYSRVEQPGRPLWGENHTMALGWAEFDLGAGWSWGTFGSCLHPPHLWAP